MTQAEIKKALETSARESYTPKTDEEIRSQAEGMYKQQFENDLKALRRQTEQNILAARRDSLSTGMQRSSYVAAQQGLARNAGLEGQQQLQSNYESSIANAIADLRDKDRDRKLADDQYRNQLLLQLYNMGGSGGGGKTSSKQTTPPGDTTDTTDTTTDNSYSDLINDDKIKLSLKTPNSAGLSNSGYIRLGSAYIPKKAATNSTMGVMNSLLNVKKLPNRFIEMTKLKK